MASVNKKYLIRYYEMRFYKNGKDVRASKLLKSLADGEIKLPVRELIDRSSDFQVRGLHSVDDGKEYRGCFVRFRDEIPLSGNKQTLDEKLIELEEGHEILEKNYFSVFVGDKYDVLIFQPTMEGGTVAGLARYLSAIAGESMMVSFNDILTEDSLESLMKGGTVKYVEFKVAKPKAKRWAPDPEDTWTQNAIDFMNETGGTSFEGKVQTRSPKKGLFAGVREPIEKLLKSNQTRKLKVKLSSISEPIDLFAERIKDKIEVTVVDGRPDPDTIYKAIWSSKIKMEPRLAAYLGNQDEILD